MNGDEQDFADGAGPPPVPARPDAGLDAGDVPDEVAFSAALAKLARIAALADEVLESALWQHSGPQAVEAVRSSAIAVRKLQAAHLAAVADLDGRTGVLTDAPFTYRAASYLQGVLRRTKGQAKLDVRSAKALLPDANPGQGGLPRLGQAFRRGEVSREHVDTCVRAVQILPAQLLPAEMVDQDGEPILDEAGNRMCAGDVIDERLTTFAKEHDSHAVSQLAKQLKDTLDPDGDFDPDTCLRRGMRTWWTPDGMFQFRGQLDPAAGSFLEGMLDQLSAPRRYQGEGEDGTLLETKDPRTPEQRVADALMEIARAGQASGRLGTRAGEPPRVTILARGSRRCPYRRCPCRR